MARREIGNVCKNKDATKANYIQIRKDLKEPIVLQAGDFLGVESKAYQLKSLAEAVSAGRIAGESAEKAQARINSIPEWVLGVVILNTKN